MRHKSLLGLFFSTATLLFVSATIGQLNNDPDTWMLPIEGFEANQQIPDSKQVLRYRWGDEISSHLQIERYLQALHQAAPDRTKLVQYGESYEGRSLNYLVISSKENIARLDDLQANIQILADPRSADDATTEQIVNNSPAFVWLAYCVHGNEISPSDAALLTAYHLLADDRQATRDWLKNLVVICLLYTSPSPRD